ncbi:hypothetical protein L1887_60795 [Cichorium endivia]|nr:hypothetical protein L1887_60795 [Cichorium endivia]
MPFLPFLPFLPWLAETRTALAVFSVCRMQMAPPHERLQQSLRGYTQSTPSNRAKKLVDSSGLECERRCHWSAMQPVAGHHATWQRGRTQQRGSQTPKLQLRGGGAQQRNFSLLRFVNNQDKFSFARHNSRPEMLRPSIAARRHKCRRMSGKNTQTQRRRRGMSVCNYVGVGAAGRKGWLGGETASCASAGVSRSQDLGWRLVASKPMQHERAPAALWDTRNPRLTMHSALSLQGRGGSVDLASSCIAVPVGILERRSKTHGRGCPQRPTAARKAVNKPSAREKQPAERGEDGRGGKNDPWVMCPCPHRAERRSAALL